MRSLRIMVAFGIAITVGLLLGAIGGRSFSPKYKPISFSSSVAVVENTVEGTSGAALIKGDLLTYTHYLCINAKESQRVRVNAQWRSYTTDKTTQDPIIDHIELVLPSGCERRTSKLTLPSSLTAGPWGLEIEIKVVKDGKITQTVGLVSTRFELLP